MNIIPTVSRKVWFFANRDKQKEPYDATVIKVHPDPDGNTGPNSLVNLDVVHPDTGTHYFEPNVPVGDAFTEDRHYEWMPYQLGQARREPKDETLTAAPADRSSQEQASSDPILPTGTVTYADGTSATGTLPLPDRSPGGAEAVTGTTHETAPA